MSTEKKKPTAKEILIAKIVNHEDSSYSEETCSKMSMRDLKTAWDELNEPAPELNTDGTIDTTTIATPPAAPTAPKSSGTRGGLRLALYEAFDKAHADGSDLKAAAREASPGTSEGVISSYLCYWRKDRGVATTRSFGGGSAKTKGQRVLELINKLYGEGADLEAVKAEVEAAKAV